MRVFFSTLGTFRSIEDRNIYADLARELVRRGHHVTIASGGEKIVKPKIVDYETYRILQFHTPQAQKSGRWGKLRSLLFYDWDLQGAIKKCLSTERFDLALVATPPITLIHTLNLLGEMGAFRYLMLKDIFPQNAVDIGLMRKNSIAHRYFRNLEKKLYRRCDAIGCMSPANVSYILLHNPELDQSKVHVLPNSTEPEIKAADMTNTRSFALDPLHIVYGGNLGKPQGIKFLIELINTLKHEDKVRFTVVGDGTEYAKLELAASNLNLTNLILHRSVPKADYYRLLQSADIGLVALDKRFTIPNFPSRMLSYMDLSKPILYVIDSATDAGEIAERENFGFTCKSGDLSGCKKTVQRILGYDRSALNRMGRKGNEYLLANYTSQQSVDIIVSRVEQPY